MAFDDFSGAADTPLGDGTRILTYPWSAGPLGIANLELDGSGNLRTTSTFATGDAFYTGATNEFYVDLPSSFGFSAGSEIGPAIHKTVAQAGYHAYIRTSPSGTTIGQIRVERENVAIAGWDLTPSVVTSWGAGLRITIKKNVSEQIEVTLDDGTNTETMTTAVDGTPLTGGNGGLRMYQSGNAAGVIAAAGDSAGAVDVTAPTTGASALQTGGTRNETITVSAVDDDAAASVTVYGVIVPLADATPSAAQVIAGQNSAGAAVAAGLADSDVVSSLPGTATLSFTGIPNAADQKFCRVAVDPDDNTTTVATLTIPAPGAGSSGRAGALIGGSGLIG